MEPGCHANLDGGMYHNSPKTFSEPWAFQPWPGHLPCQKYLTKPRWHVGLVQLPLVLLVTWSPLPTTLFQPMPWIKPWPGQDPKLHPGTPCIWRISTCAMPLRLYLHFQWSHTSMLASTGMYVPRPPGFSWWLTVFKPMVSHFNWTSTGDRPGVLCRPWEGCIC